MARDLTSLVSVKHRRQTFQPSCPAGGQFYACDYGSRFVGCCTSEPCAAGCPSSDLKPSSFLKEKYDDLPGALCRGDSKWYKCAGTIPPFMGCCKSDPCTQNGCPSDDLTPAILASDPPEASPYSPIPNPTLVPATGSVLVRSSTQSPSSSSRATSSTTNVPSESTSPNDNEDPIRNSASSAAVATGFFVSASRATPTATTLPPASASSATSKAGIIGGVVGGVLAVVFVILLFFLYRRRKARKGDPSAFTRPELPDIAVTMAPTTPEADSRPLVQLDGSPVSEMTGSPSIAQLDGSPISELYPSPRPIYEFPA